MTDGTAAERKAAGFDLLDEEWIPLLGQDGVTREACLVEAFRAAPFATQIVGEVPTQGFALLRMLLAILHRATAREVDGQWRNGPVSLRHWEELAADWGNVADAAACYLDRFRDRFDLFHPETPFLQVADLATRSGEVSGLEKLVVDVPNGRPFFTTRVGPGLRRLAAAEAARWLVHVHAFDASGIRSGDPRDPRVKAGKGYPIGPGWTGQIGGIHLEGRTLAETLLLNLGSWSEPVLGMELSALDLPPWELPQLGAAVEHPDGRPPRGPVDVYTWQSRRVRLHGDRDGVTAVVICQGDKITPQNKHTTEPMTVWRHSEPQSKKFGTTVYMAARLDPTRSLWRGLESVLPQTTSVGSGSAPAKRLTPTVVRWSELLLDRSAPSGLTHVNLHAVGLSYGSNDSVVDELVDDRLRLPVALLAPGAEQLRGLAVHEVGTAKAAAEALRGLAQSLAVAGGAGRDERQGPGKAAEAHAYHLLGRAYRNWLATLDPGEPPTLAVRRWRREVRSVALGCRRELVNSCPPTAWGGRVDNKEYVDVGSAVAAFDSELAKIAPAEPRPEPGA